MLQSEIDVGGYGQLTVEVAERATEPQDHSLSVDFGELLFWISPEVTTDFRLSSLTLLGTSAHIGCGRLSASMARTEDPATSGDGVGAVEEWTVSIDRDTVTAPPLPRSQTKATSRCPVKGPGATAQRASPSRSILTAWSARSC